MKLIFCKKCQDIVRLIRAESRECQCGAIGGKYLDEVVAEYWGEDAVPIGFHNTSFRHSIIGQPKQGLGKEFRAFVIPKDCDTFVRVNSMCRRKRE